MATLPGTRQPPGPEAGPAAVARCVPGLVWVSLRDVWAAVLGSKAAPLLFLARPSAIRGRKLNKHSPVRPQDARQMNSVSTGPTSGRRAPRGAAGRGRGGGQEGLGVAPSRGCASSQGSVPTSGAGGEAPRLPLQPLPSVCVCVGLP